MNSLADLRLVELAEYNELVRAVTLKQRAADNDESCAEAVDSAASARPTSVELRLAARAMRSRMVGDLIANAMEWTSQMAQRALARHRRDRRVRAAYDDLQHLDDRMLRDLGFCRGEIAEVAVRFVDDWRGPT